MCPKINKITTEDRIIKILAEFLQDEKKHIIGLFESEEALKDFLKQIPFLIHEMDHFEDEQLNYYSLEYATIPPYYEVNYRGYTYIISKYMFSPNEPIDILWQEVHDWSKKAPTEAKVFVDDCTLVDAYYIPNDEVEQYIQEREAVAKEIKAYYASLGLKAERCFTGSEDGEAVVGLNTQGDVEKLIHLDPETIEGAKNAKVITAFLSSIS